MLDHDNVWLTKNIIYFTISRIMKRIISVDSRTALKKPSKNSLHKLGKKSNFLNSQLTGWGWNGFGWDMRGERGRETH